MKLAPILASVCLLAVAYPVFAQTAVEAYQSTLLAGNNAGLTIIDGPGVDARFQSITAIWGNGTSLYVADSNTIRRIDLSSPTKQVTTLSQTASNGTQHAGSGSQFSYLYRGLYGLWGNDSFLYATDIGADSVRQISLTTGGVKTVAQSLPYPWGLSGDGTNLYVGASSNGSVMRVDPISGISSKLATTGSGTPRSCIGGSGCLGYFVPGPRSAWGNAQSLYLSGYSGTVMKLDLATGTQTLLPAVPFNIGAISGAGNQLFVAATTSSQLGSVALDTGVFTALPVPPGAFSIPALWSDGSGLYIAIGAALSGQAIERIDLQTGQIDLVAGHIQVREFTDGAGGAARFQNPEGAWSDGQNLYIADTGNFTIRKLELSTGTVTTFAGQPNRSTILDGFGTAAAFNEPRSLWGDGAHLYVTDSNSVRSVDLVTAQVITLAGSANSGKADGPSATAGFNRPFGLWGRNGILYIADYGNSVIRQLDLTSNQVTTLAGGYGISAAVDGVGLNARFIGPASLWGDGTTLYVGSVRAVRTIALDSAAVGTLASTPNYGAQALWGNGRALYILNSDSSAGSAVHLLRVDIATGTVTELVFDNNDVKAGEPIVFPGGWGIWGDGANLFTTDYTGNAIRRLTPAPPSTLTRQQITNPGYSSNTTAGTATAISVGYAKPTVDTANVTLSGFAIFGLRQNGVLVSEASVPALPAILSGRIPSSTIGVVRAGLAIANPNAAAAVITFYFTDSAGHNDGQGTMTLPAGAQIARFLSEDPFNGPARPDGTFTFVSSIPVSALALRGYINERSEFLMSTLPVLDLSQRTSTSLTLSHYAAGGGWITELVLINPSDQAISGTVQLLGGNSTISYGIPARSSQLFDFGGTAGTVTTGAFRVFPASGSTPGAVAIFSFVENGIRVSEASVPDVPPAPAFHLYAELSGGSSQAPGSKRSGFAITNTSNAPQDVTVELTTAAGAAFNSNRPIPPVTIHVDAGAHVAMFLDEIPNLFPSDGAYFVRISTLAPEGVSLIGLRGRYNERGEFLITTTPAAPEDTNADLTPRYIAHVVDGGGYTTQFVFFSATAQSATTGFTVTARYVSQTGTALALPNQ